MTHNTPLSPRPLSHLRDAPRQVATLRSLRSRGVTAGTVQERCRPGGPWQLLLPGVCLLHPGPATSEERLHAVLLWADRGPVPAQGGPGMITGMAALALHGLTSAPGLRALEHIDLLVPRTRRLRSTGWVRVVRGQALPHAEQVTGLPVAPVARALADAVARITDEVLVRRLLTEAVRGGHCEAQAVVEELRRARLLSRPQVADVVGTLTAEGRATAEGRLYDLVRSHHLPQPCWHVDLRLPAGPHLGGVDAYWPEHGVALELDWRDTEPAPADADAHWAECARKRETLERLGVTVLHVTPEKLRNNPEQQAAVLRTALVTWDERDPAAHLVVLPQ
ncbi:hypothetical protein QNO07_13515 [Streptomyces sp. 549]|uniref:hypothetical protein n=1 Tax=Streptomyces sp. 549 TaxID=3049076 RepID=UPI0024C2E9CE|nr:hypothetical protein [Streptomyces sp. 549]MDK1474425.1 hypothetical protein [Streptomyces sp. 549]